MTSSSGLSSLPGPRRRQPPTWVERGRKKTTTLVSTRQRCAAGGAHRGQARGGGSAGPVVRVDQSAGEGALLHQIEAHTVGEEPLAAADHARGDEQVVLVHQA